MNLSIKKKIYTILIEINNLTTKPYNKHKLVYVNSLS